jgi:hypothetical protein
MTKAEVSLIRAVYLLKCALADLEGEIDFIDPNNDEDDPHPARRTIDDIKVYLEYTEQNVVKPVEARK